MFHLLPPWPLLAAFLIASLVLAVTPGPGVFYIVTRSLSQGRSAGLASVAGVALGNLSNAIGASIGLAALFALSTAAFVVVKYAGALYLVWLGVQALRRKDAPTRADQPPTSLRRVFRDGFVVALLNPKTTLFFAAFLPQFIVPGPATALRSVLLGSLFVSIAAATDTGYALTAGAVSLSFGRSPRVRTAGRYLSGSAFIGLGLFTALTGARSAK